MGRKLRWDNEEGHWYTGTRQREEPLSVAAVRVAPASMPSSTSSRRSREVSRMT